MLPYSLTTYGFPHRMGYLATRDGVKYPRPFSIPQLLDEVKRFDLHGIDMPLPDPAVLPDEALIDLLAERDLRITVEFMALPDVSEEAAATMVRRAAAVGAKVMRTLISTVLCGDRRPLPEGWEARLAVMAERLKAILPIAADLGIALAVENHQDATTDDLLLLHSMTDYHPAYGITLDTGNPLAVGEEPVQAARRLAPLIRHLHLKDYTIHYAPQGYRLVRCAAGDGVIDFPAILSAVRDNGFPYLLPGIEIAAQPTRTIPILDRGWWDGYPSTPTTDLIGALRILWEKGRPQDAPYSSAWERGENSEVVGAEEWDIVTRSVAYFAGLTGHA
ncbi:MAG: sugar phosphate isomerase/epimerase [Capsulimonadales bacterium]|nr:sugar phosphate isomerase/epimerase [Capsulimonadales bacterium]